MDVMNSNGNGSRMQRKKPDQWEIGMNLQVLSTLPKKETKKHGNQSHGGLVQMIFSKSGVYQIPAISFQGKYRVLFPTTSHLACNYNAI